MGQPRVIGKNALIGSIVSAGFGIGWVEWGTLNLGGTASTVIRVVGVVIGVVLIVRSIRLRHQQRVAQRANPGSAEPSMLASRGYRLVVAVEAAALIAGYLVLGAIGHGTYQIVWFALVVGVHFVVFGRLFEFRFYFVGAALIAAAIAGLIVGIAGGGVALVQAVTGFASGLTLFVTPLVTIVQYQAQQSQVEAVA
ncbi:MAG TPA: hypothetical protein VJ914_14180 [Pseudonocardiaceae bacterium]|nr:hypothetical protein [Pseudonocardiaceae bacterium]